jgi:hypothetical protein
MKKKKKGERGIELGNLLKVKKYLEMELLKHNVFKKCAEINNYSDDKR